MVKKKKALRTQQWQVEEDNAYATCAKSLHDLTMNDHVSDENWYRSACYEARKLHTKKKNVKIRAIKAGIAKGSKGVTVVNKDSIDPITVKKTSTLELHHIYEVSKKHKWLVDTAAPAIDCHLDKYQKKQFKRATRSAKQRELHPDIKDWPFTLKNHASRKNVLSWDNTRSQLKHLVQTSKPAVDCQLDKWQQAQLDRAHKMTDHHPDFPDFPLAAKNYAPRREVKSWDRTNKFLKKLVKTAQTGTVTTLDKHWQARLDESAVRKKQPDTKPSFPQYPITLKNHSSYNEVAGWSYDDKKLKRLCDDACVQIDTKWGSKNILIPDKFKFETALDREKKAQKKLKATLHAKKVAHFLKHKFHLHEHKLPYEPQHLFRWGPEHLQYRPTTS